MPRRKFGVGAYKPEPERHDRAHAATRLFHADLALEEKLNELLGPFDAFDPANDWNYPKREEP